MAITFKFFTVSKNSLSCSIMETKTEELRMVLCHRINIKTPWTFLPLCLVFSVYVRAWEVPKELFNRFILGFSVSVQINVQKNASLWKPFIPYLTAQFGTFPCCNRAKLMEINTGIRCCTSQNRTHQENWQHHFCSPEEQVWWVHFPFIYVNLLKAYLTTLPSFLSQLALSGRCFSRIRRIHMCSVLSTKVSSKPSSWAHWILTANLEVDVILLSHVTDWETNSNVIPVHGWVVKPVSPFKEIAIVVSTSFTLRTAIWR